MENEKEQRKMSAEEFYTKIKQLIAENGFKDKIYYVTGCEKYSDGVIEEHITIEDVVSVDGTGYLLNIKMTVDNNLEKDMPQTVSSNYDQEKTCKCKRGE